MPLIPFPTNVQNRFGPLGVRDSPLKDDRNLTEYHDNWGNDNYQQYNNSPGTPCGGNWWQESNHAPAFNHSGRALLGVELVGFFPLGSDYQKGHRPKRGTRGGGGSALKRRRV